MAVLENTEMYFYPDDGEPIPLTVSYYFHQEKKALQEVGGIPLEPPEPSWVEVVRITTLDGEPPEFHIPDYDPKTAQQVFSFQLLQEIKHEY